MNNKTRGRPRLPESKKHTVRLCVMLTEDLRNQLDNLAQSEDIPISQVVRQALNQYTQQGD